MPDSRTTIHHQLDEVPHDKGKVERGER